jgi:4-oxalocrotonate tautomerase
MPVVQVELLTGRSNEQKEAIAKGITQVMCDAAGLTPESIWVIFNEIPPEDFYIAAENFVTIRKKRAAATKSP